MKGKKTIGTGIILLLFYFGFSQNFELVENKGQWNEKVKFAGRLSTGGFFLEPQGYKVLQHNQDDLAEITAQLHGHKTIETKTQIATADKFSKIKLTANDLILHSHAYEVLFTQSNPNPEVVAEKPQPGYNNYFLGNDKSKWAGNCKIYGAVTYKNMYRGIDVRYYSDNNNLKYDIIVQPYADISKLALQYDGTDGLEIKNGDLYIKTSVGEIKEQYPYAYQLINGVRTRIDCKYKLLGNTVYYQLSNYDPSKTVVIDPTLIFSTFTGSQADNWGYTATYGPDGAMYGGGIVFGNGYPVSNGAFQTNYGGGTNTGEGDGFDIGIIKLSANGSQRIYATYVGGNGNEAPHSMIVDAQGNLIVAGRTTSSNFPAFVKRGPLGGWDIIVFKLNNTGNAMVGSMQLGGSADDGVNIRNKYPNPTATSLMENYGDDSRSEVILDNGGNIILASCTQSADFPVTPNAFQLTKAGGQDALFLRFDANLTTQIFTSFLGGSNNDAAYVLNSNPQTGEVWIGGGTESANFLGDKTGTIGPNFNGNIDGFVAIITGTVLTKSTFIGTVGNDQVYGLKFDNNGFPYIIGTTTGNFPIQNAAFSQVNGKQFIGKLKTDLSGYVYSTVFGSGDLNPNISPIAFLVDRCENVYVSGWGGSLTDNNPFHSAGTNRLSVTPDAIQSTTDGRDFYFFVLEKDASRQLYGSFFGQNGGATDHVDGGTSRFDNNGVIYQAICANCGGGTPFPVTPGAWSTANRAGSGCNEALLKIEFNLAGVKGGIKPSIGGIDGDTSGCVPLNINFRDTVALAKSYEWNFGDGSGDFTTTSSTVSHVFNTIGTFKVRMIAIDSTKCYPRDTSYVNVKIRNDAATLNAFAMKIPPCESTTYQFINLSTPSAGKSFGNNSFTWIWGDNSPNVVTGINMITHSYPGVGNYNAKMVLNDTNFCNSPDTFSVRVSIAPNVKAAFITPTSGCAPYNASFTNTSLGGTTFSWNFGDGSNSNSFSPNHIYASPGIYTIKLTVIDSSTCNIIDSTLFTITVSDKPTASFIYTPNPPIENESTTFINNSLDAVKYIWLFGDGDFLNTFRKDTTIIHQYNETKSFQPCLVAINQFNCLDTACLSINIVVNPILDVPNAFTPNGDGVNDIAKVIGVGISRMDFRIYNRWGQLLFQTNSRKQGWDGSYKGKQQPMDVYAYVLDAEFFNGQKVRKQGDITLIR